MADFAILSAYDVLFPEVRRPQTPRALTGAGLGSSSIAGGHSVSGNSVASVASGYTSWLQVLSGGRLRIPRSMNFGVSGDTSTAIRARLPSLLAVSDQFDVVTFHGFTNDALGTVARSTVVDNIKNIFGPILDIGKPISAVVPQPVIGYSDAVNKSLLNYQDWFRGYCGSRSGIHLTDMPDGLIDPTATTFQSKAAYLDQSAGGTQFLHLNNLGAYLYGSAMAAQPFIQGLTPKSPVCRSAADLYDPTYYPTGNLLSNGMFTGAGPLATGWQTQDATGGATVTPSLITTPNGEPAQRLTFSGNYTSTGGFYTVFADIPTPSFVQAGDTIGGACKVICSATQGIASVAMDILPTIGGVDYDRWAHLTTLPQVGVPNAWTGVLWPDDQLLSAAPSRVRVRIRVYLVNGSNAPISGTVDMVGPAVRRLVP